MTRVASQGSSVEGEKLTIVTRQFFPGRPTKCQQTNKRKYPFRLGIFGSAVIREAYADPKNSVYFVTSLTDVDDEVHGTSLSGWAYKPLGEPHVQKETHTHSGSSLKISGGCLAQVETPPREHLDSEEIQKRHPPVVPIVREVQAKSGLPAATDF